MCRLYLLLPSQESCSTLIDELRSAGVAEARLHVVAGAGLELRGLPLASAWQTTELARGIVIGIALGAAAGLLSGLVGRNWPPPGVQVSAFMVAASVLAGAAFGAVASASMKRHQHNRRLRRFHADVEAGHILLMVDVPAVEVKAIRSVINRHHRDAMLETARPV